MSVQFYGPFSFSCYLGAFHYVVYWCFNDVLHPACVPLQSIMHYTHGERLCVSQLCVQRSVSMAAACLLIPASVNPDGGDWTALVVSALNSETLI